jgi:hypothetical protein
MVYDRVIIGSLLADFNPKSPAAESTLEQAIQQTKTGGSFDANLIRYFASAPAPAAK